MAALVYAPGILYTTQDVVGGRKGGILLDQGSKLCLLYWKADSLPLSPQGSPSVVLIVVTAGYHLQKNYLPLSLVLLSVRI